MLAYLFDGVFAIGPGAALGLSLSTISLVLACLVIISICRHSSAAHLILVRHLFICEAISNLGFAIASLYALQQQAEEKDPARQGTLCALAMLMVTMGSIGAYLWATTFCYVVFNLVQYMDVMATKRDTVAMRLVCYVIPLVIGLSSVVIYGVSDDDASLNTLEYVESLTLLIVVLINALTFVVLVVQLYVYRRIDNIRETPLIGVIESLLVYPLVESVPRLMTFAALTIERTRGGVPAPMQLVWIATMTSSSLVCSIAFFSSNRSMLRHICCYALPTEVPVLKGIDRRSTSKRAWIQRLSVLSFGTSFGSQFSNRTIDSSNTNNSVDVRAVDRISSEFASNSASYRAQFSARARATLTSRDETFSPLVGPVVGVRIEGALRAQEIEL